MAKKRAATSELNHDNWNAKEEVEEGGTFRQADSKILQGRVIKTAKRRSGASFGTPEAKSSPFSGFSAFGNTATSSPSAFSFLNKVVDPQKNVELKQSDKAKSDSTVKPFESLFKNNNEEKKDSEMKDLQLLKDLNVSCSNWILEHVQKNPFCILTPIFKDYEEHLSKLKLDLKNDDVNNKTVKPENSLTSTKEPTSTTTASPFATTQSPFLNSISGGFSFGNSTQTTFSTGSTASPFSIVGAAPTFKINTEQKNEGDGNGNAADEDEPPKVEFTRVVEDDSLFSIKCKVFVMKVVQDGQTEKKEYASRGVGMLHLKPVKESKKTQLLVRADTNLGNVLLNILVTNNLPLQKSGNNNIMLVCLPTPDSKPPPTTVLIRLKTSEECEQVIKKVKELVS